MRFCKIPTVPARSLPLALSSFALSSFALLFFALSPLVFVQSAKGQGLGGYGSGGSGFGILLGGEGVLSLSLSDRKIGVIESDKIGIGGGAGLQLGALYRDFALVTRTRVGAATSFKDPPYISVDLYATYQLPVRALDVWIGGGYSALFPSTSGKLAQSKHPYHGALIVLGNSWTRGLYSEYGLGFYPNQEGVVDELLVDINISIGYRFKFQI